MEAFDFLNSMKRPQGGTAGAEESAFGQPVHQPKPSNGGLSRFDPVQRHFGHFIDCIDCRIHTATLARNAKREYRQGESRGV